MLIAEMFDTNLSPYSMSALGNLIIKLLLRLYQVLVLLKVISLAFLANSSVEIQSATNCSLCCLILCVMRILASSGIAATSVLR